MIDGPRVNPASGGQAKSLVVFLHGYGANGDDLIAIGRQWQAAMPDTAFVAPHAPDAVSEPGTPPGFTGRQWFPLTMRDPNEYKAGITDALPALGVFLDQEMARHGVTDAQTALVGFSQGTMMALGAGPTRRLAGIVGFSGLLADPTAWTNDNTVDGTEPPPVLLIHGEADEVIPVQALFAAIAGLGASKTKLEWHVTPGLGHGIDADGLSIAGDFLRRVLATPNGA